MGWTKVWQYSKLVKCPLENQYFASYIAIAAVYFERICMYFLAPVRFGVVKEDNVKREYYILCADPDKQQSPNGQNVMPPEAR